MYISRVFLDKNKHETAKALYNRNILHGAVESCFEGERQHPLWRIDRINSEWTLLLVSRDIPDFSHFYRQFGREGKCPQIKEYDNFANSIARKDAVLRFRLSANPVVKKDNTRVPLNLKRTEKQPYCVEDWLEDRIKANGAEVISFDVSDYQKHIIKNKENRITLSIAAFDGSLKITDPDIFTHALFAGIGHGKAYGCGLITVMR